MDPQGKDWKPMDWGFNGWEKAYLRRGSVQGQTATENQPAQAVVYTPGPLCHVRRVDVDDVLEHFCGECDREVTARQCAGRRCHRRVPGTPWAGGWGPWGPRPA